MDEASPEALREAGRLAEAAAAYRLRGDLHEAEALYKELWSFAAAAEVALERGDRPAALGHLLSANDSAAAVLLGRTIEQGSEVELRRAAEVYERHRRWLDAAMFRERLGELAPARDLYRKAQALLEVARIERSLGRLREAGLAYEQALAGDPEGPDSVRARLELGQLLLALDRPEDAALHLQAALRRSSDATRPSLLGELVLALDRLGYADSADSLLDELRKQRPDTPTRAGFLAAHRPAQAAGPTRLAGRYEVERLLGAGASGRVFLARDSMTGRQVAVKSLAPPIEQRAQQSWARFFTEARLIASVRHPNVVEVIDVNEELGLLVMEHVASGTLLSRLPRPSSRGEGLSPAAVRRLLLDVIDALAAVHARGIVHRDLKPANLFYTATGQVKLGDFGSAHLFADEATQTAGFIGTLAYMAPEQMTGISVGAAADVYALGAVAFHALTGQLPFPGPDFVSQHLGQPAPPPRSIRPSLDPAWDQLLMRMLEKAPADRPASLDELRRAVERMPISDEHGLHRDEAPPAVRVEPAAEERYVRNSELPSGAGGPIALGMDARLGREVIIETLRAAYLESETGQRHLAWLKAIARRGSPRVQRLFALGVRADGGVDAVFEAILPQTTGPATDAAHTRGLLARSIDDLHADGVVHGSLSRSIVHEPHGPVILLAGRAPVTGATPEDDLRALQLC